MDGVEKLVQFDSRRPGVNWTRVFCALGRVEQLPKTYQEDGVTYRIDGATYCRRSLELALQYAVNGPQSVHPEARKAENDPLEMYMGLGFQLSGIRSKEVAMQLVNDIVAASANNESKAPVQIIRRNTVTGQTLMMQFSLGGVLDAAAVKELMEVQNGRAPKRQPIPQEIMNSGFAKCIYVNTSRESEFDASRTQRGGCVQGGEFLVARFFADKNNRATLRP